MAEMSNILTFSKNINDTVNIFGRQLIVIRYLNAFFGSVNEHNLVIAFSFFEHHNTGCNTRTEEKAAAKLDNRIHVVVVHQILANLLLRTATVHNTGEAYNGSRAVGSKPGQAVHDESHISLALGCKHACRSKTRIVNQGSIAVTNPFYGIRRV